ncbi:unnamed protein product [Lota lota]
MALFCQDCSMVFSSDSLLQRHHAQFCVGNATGDPAATCREPEHLVSDTGIGVEPKRTLTPQLIKAGRDTRLRLLKERSELHMYRLAQIQAQNQQLQWQREGQRSASHLENLLLQQKDKEERSEEMLRQLTRRLDTLQEVRQAYMSSGGSDPRLLAQMMDLQLEAGRLEQVPLDAQAKEVKGHYWRGPNQEVLALEYENQRLEHKILQIQAARRGYSGNEALVDAELQRDNLYRMVAMKAEMEVLHREMKERSRDVARAGLVIFYDMVVGIDATLSTLRLVSSLYLGDQEVGQPAPLPCVPCQPGVEMPFSQRPPPGVLPPYPGLSLVVEVQAPGEGSGPRKQLQDMMSLGWARLELFDLNNQLHSGYWKVPVRSLPVTPAINQVYLDSVPQEMCKCSLVPVLLDNMNIPWW